MPTPDAGITRSRNTWRATALLLAGLLVLIALGLGIGGLPLPIPEGAQ